MLPALLLGLAVVVVVGCASLLVGITRVPASEVLDALVTLCGSTDGERSPHAVVVEVRLLRALAGSCVGAALGASGCMLQAVLRNPVASPAVIGVAQAAGFGASLAILLGQGFLGTLGGALTGSCVAMALLLVLTRTRGMLPVETVVLTGMAIGLFFTAAVGLLRTLTRDEHALGRIALWLGGGLWAADWDQLARIAPALLVALVIAHLCARELDLLSLGESDALRLGLRVSVAVPRVLVLACVLTSLAVCLGGMIAFVGLVVPHLARRLVGPLHAGLLPLSTCLGAALVVVTDATARTALAPQEAPLTVVTSLLGVPTFLVLMRTPRHRRPA